MLQRPNDDGIVEAKDAIGTLRLKEADTALVVENMAFGLSQDGMQILGSIKQELYHTSRLFCDKWSS